MKPTPFGLFKLWGGIGVQSIGGGQAVMLLAYREFVEVQGWMTAEEWAGAFSLCQLVPGMVVVAMVALTGRRLAGTLGVALSLLGLMIPSVLITIVFAAGVSQAERVPGVSAALHGIVLAVSGGSLVVLWKLARPFLESSAREGRWILAAAMAVPVLACLLLIVKVPVFAIMMAGGGALALVAWRLPAAGSPEPLQS